MITRKDILMKVERMLGGFSPEDRIYRERLLNSVLVSMSESHSFHHLRRQMEVDLSTSSSVAGEEGVWLPANLAGIDAVQDKETGVFLIPRDKSAVSADERGMPRFSMYTPGLPPLFYADDLRMFKGETVIDSPSLAQEGTTYAGEWVRLGSEPQAFLLDSTGQALTEKYWGPELVDEGLTVRPSAQRKLVVHDTHNQINTRGRVIVHYWIYHPLMYRDSDELLFPHPPLLWLTMMREAKGGLARRSRDPINTEIAEARAETIRLNPSFSQPIHPRDRIGGDFDPTRLQYASRDSIMDLRDLWMGRR